MTMTRTSDTRAPRGEPRRGRAILVAVFLLFCATTLGTFFQARSAGANPWAQSTIGLIAAGLAVLATLGNGWARNGLVDVIALGAIFGGIASVAMLFVSPMVAIVPVLVCGALGGLARFLHTSRDVGSLY